MVYERGRELPRGRPDRIVASDTDAVRHGSVVQRGTAGDRRPAVGWRQRSRRRSARFESPSLRPAVRHGEATRDRVGATGRDRLGTRRNPLCPPARCVYVPALRGPSSRARSAGCDAGARRWRRRCRARRRRGGRARRRGRLRPGRGRSARGHTPTTATTATTATAAMRSGETRVFIVPNLRAGHQARRCGVAGSWSSTVSRTRSGSAVTPSSSHDRTMRVTSRSVLIGQPPAPPVGRRPRGPRAGRASRDVVGIGPSRRGRRAMSATSSSGRSR